MITQIQQPHHITSLLQTLLTLSTVFGENTTRHHGLEPFQDQASVCVSLLTSCLLPLSDEAPGSLSGPWMHRVPPAPTFVHTVPPWSGQCLYFRLQGKHQSLPVMVNFIRQLDAATGCPDICSNVIPGISVTKSFNEINV